MEIEDCHNLNEGDLEQPMYRCDVKHSIGGSILHCRKHSKTQTDL